MLGLNQSEMSFSMYDGFLKDGVNLELVKLTAFNRTFFILVSVRSQFIYQWVTLLASPLESKNYTYQSKVDNGDSVSSYTQVRSMCEIHEEIIEKQLAFVIGIPVARRLMNQDGIIEFSVKLRSLKDEAKDETDESGIDDD